MSGCLRTHVRKLPIIALSFEFETVLKFYNLKAWTFIMLIIQFRTVLLSMKVWMEMGVWY